MIRLPQPTTIENYPSWARLLVQTLELQQRQNEQGNSSIHTESEDQATATGFFFG